MFFYTFLALVATYVFVFAVAWFWGERIAFPAPRATYTDTADFFKLTIKSGEKITARFLGRKDAEVVILYNHGNGEDIFSISDILREYAARGFGILSYDYCGYGTSEGSPTEANALLAADAAWDYLTKTLNIAETRIAVIGFSVGSAPAAHLLARADISPRCGVFVGGVAKGVYTVLPVNILPFALIDNIARISKAKAPCLFLHGTYDFVVPSRNGRKLYDACASEHKRIEYMQGFGHMDLTGDAFYWQTVTDFIKNPSK